MNGYFKVTFDIKPFSSDAADLLAAFLADIGFESFEESSSGITGYVPENLFDKNAVEEVLNSFPMDVSLTSSSEFIPQQDWNSEWEKNYFQPIVLADGKCVIHSTFHKDFPECACEVIVDPKMAFGTGHHATTAMMVDHLFNLDLRNKNVVDMGSGTGILAILAEKLNAGAVTAIEIDPGAYENARENAQLNNAQINFENGDAELLKDLKDIDIFLANINRNIILADLDRYIATLNHSGILVLSGFYEKDIPLLEAALNQNGMKIAEIKTAEENWASLRAEKL